jgi:pimeloyl-ACP methyl ester carboxylesterase
MLVPNAQKIARIRPLPGRRSPVKSHHYPTKETSNGNTMNRSITVAGVTLEIDEAGQGPMLLFLHPGEGSQPNRPWFEALARDHHVIAPHHPGFGKSGLPDWFGTVDDIAYLYLDLAKQLGLEKAVLVGACFGGWIAAEMMVRDTNRFAGLVLSAPLGIKAGGVLDRDIADMHSIPRAEFLRLAWADPANGTVDYASLPDIELAAIARSRESLALFGWKPYMHNPRLKRWLHRIDIPTLLIWGDSDGIVSTAYGEAWQAELPGSTMTIIPQAGHYPHWEQPDAFAAAVGAFTSKLQET